MTRRLALVLALLVPAFAQADEPLKIGLGDYLTRVASGNLELAAQQANVSISRAQIAIVKVFPDPSVTAGLQQLDVSGHGIPTATALSFNVPIQIGGQRGARVRTAEANVSAAEADLEDFVRTLRGGAAAAYVAALQARGVLDRKKQTLASLERLVKVNELRLRAGDIGEALLVQSRVEAQQFRGDVMAAEGVVAAADFAVVQFLGEGARAVLGRPIAPQGDLRVAAERKYDVKALLSGAVSRRPDLRASQRRVTAAEKQLELTRKNRIVDIAVGASWQHNFSTSGASAAPASDQIGILLSVPLAISRIYRGDIDAATATQRQADAQQRAVSLRVEIEIRQAVMLYDIAAARLKLYTSGVLHDADAVLEKTLYNYQRGGATLVEVLVAQRTVNDVYIAYWDALGDAARALIAVEQAAGTWDVRL